jgi:hypothetical protein
MEWVLCLKTKLGMPFTRALGPQSFSPPGQLRLGPHQHSNTVIINSTRVKAENASLRVLTGTAAKITALHVYDGEKKILDLNGTIQTISERIPGKPGVHWGAGISLLVQFIGTGSDAYVKFVGAGIDFY